MYNQVQFAIDGVEYPVDWLYLIYQWPEPPVLRAHLCAPLDQEPMVIQLLLGYHEADAQVRELMEFTPTRYRGLVLEGELDVE